MQFLEHHVDDPMLSALRDEGVIGPAEIDLMDSRLGSQDAIRLNDALMAVANDVREGAWLEWLVHVHDCVRLKKVEPDSAMLLEAGFTAEQARGFMDSGNYPCLRTEDGWMLAITRPDLFERTETYLPGVRLYRMAVTLSEARELRAIFERVATTYSS